MRFLHFVRNFIFSFCFTSATAAVFAALWIKFKKKKQTEDKINCDRIYSRPIADLCTSHKNYISLLFTNYFIQNKCERLTKQPLELCTILNVERREASSSITSWIYSNCNVFAFFHCVCECKQIKNGKWRNRLLYAKTTWPQHKKNMRECVNETLKRAHCRVKNARKTTFDMKMNIHKYRLELFRFVSF